MDDGRVWAFEESLWKADEAHYRETIDDDCLMVVPAPPFIMTGGEAAEAVAKTPRWTEVAFDNGRISRIQHGLIVVAYEVRASRDDAEPYDAHCTSTYLLGDADTWTVIQHQQTPKLVMS